MMLQQCAENFRRVGVVFDDEHAKRSRSGRRCGRNWGTLVQVLQAWDSDREFRSLSGPGARYLDRTTVQLDQTLGDGKTKSQSTVLAIDWLLGLGERLEDARQQ